MRGQIESFIYIYTKENRRDKERKEMCYLQNRNMLHQLFGSVDAVIDRFFIASGSG